MDRLTSSAVALAGLMALPANAGELRIAVAANFRSTLESLVADYVTQAPEVRISLSSASTGALYTQIRHGAPFDLFLSADDERPHQLVTEGLARADTRFTYALGQLALWHDGPEPVDNRHLADWSGRLAMANPRLAPYGEAAQQTLESLGLWPSLQQRLVTGASITQTFQYVYSGNVKLGFVSYSQWLASDQERGTVWLVPETLFTPIAQQAVVLKQGRDLPAALAFLDYLQSPAAEVIIRQAGYRLPQPVVTMRSDQPEPDADQIQ